MLYIAYLGITAMNNLNMQSSTIETIKPNRCSFIMPDGNRCGGYQITDSIYCHVHSGGKPAKSTTAESIIKSPMHVLTYIGSLVKKAENGTLEPNIVNCITNALDKALKCQQIINVESRLKEIMAQLQGDQGYVLAQDMDCLDIEPEEDRNESKAIESKDK